MIVDPFRGRGMDREDRIKVIEEVRKDCHALYFACNNFKDDKEVVLEAVKFRGLALEFASERMKNDQDVVIEAVKDYGRSIHFANEKMKENKTVLKEGIKAKQWLLLKFVTEKMKQDDEEFHGILVEAVKSLGENLSIPCCRYLGDDYDLLMGAVKETGVNLEYGSDRLKRDKDIALAAVNVGGCGFAVKFCGENIRDDKDILMTYVSVRGLSLEYASDRLKNDRELVFKAVTTNGFALEFTSKQLQDDREIVHSSVTSHGETLYWGSERLKSDRDLVLDAVRNKGVALEHADVELQNDREVVLEAVKQEGIALKFGHKKFRSDREIVIEMVKHDGSLLYSLATKNLKDDTDLMILSMSTMSMEDIKIPFRRYPSRSMARQFLLRALKSNSDVAHYVDNKLFSDKSFLKKCMNINALVSEKMITKAFKINWKMYKDEPLLIACARYYNKAITHCNYSLRRNARFMRKFLSVNITGIHECLWYLKMDTDEKWIIEAFHDQEKYREIIKKDLSERVNYLCNDYSSSSTTTDDEGICKGLILKVKTIGGSSEICLIKCLLDI